MISSFYGTILAVYVIGLIIALSVQTSLDYSEEMPLSVQCYYILGGTLLWPVALGKLIAFYVMFAETVIIVPAEDTGSCNCSGGNKEE